MNAHFFRIIRLLALALGLSASLCAQEPAPPAPPVVVTAFAWDVFDTEKDLTVNYRHKGKKQTVEIAWRDRSVPQACDGPGAQVFTQKVIRDGKSSEVPVSKAEIPDAVTLAMLVFGRNPSG